MRLDAFRIRDLRCFKDSGPLELADLNIFIGPNNAGKTTLLGAVELLLGSLDSPELLALTEQAAFASFDSVIRNHWSKNNPKPTSIKISAKWTLERSNRKKSKRKRSKTSIDIDYICTKSKLRPTTTVSEIKFQASNPKGSLHFVSEGEDSRLFLPLSKKGEPIKELPVLFYGLVPMLRTRDTGYDKLSKEQMNVIEWLQEIPIRFRNPGVAVIKPMRPNPRSVYVLDDPSLTSEQREIVSELLRIFEQPSDQNSRVKELIIKNFRALGLAEKLQVSPVSTKSRQVAAEIRVDSKTARRDISIADAGFGVSQVLPLITIEARLSKGVLVAYQPEVHLHPFAQSRLSDLFVSSVKRGNRIFVETHSVPLLLRLQSLIAMGKISPERVRVYCVENEKDASVVRPINFSADGSPKIRWPKGFLDTNLELAKELTKFRLNRKKTRTP